MNNNIYFIIRLIQIPYNFLPRFICDYLWNVFSISESKIALLYRYLFLNRYANQVGKNVYLGKYITIKNIQYLKLGNNVSIHAYSYIDAFGGIEIGSDVSIANHVTIISSDHTWSDSNKPIKYNPVDPKKIIIENDVWIAAGVRILGGIIVKKRNVIGAGAVVNKSTEENSVFVGVPIRKIKEI